MTLNTEAYQGAAAERSARYQTEDMNETVPVPTAALLSVRRLLWDIGASESTQHDQRVECLHWAALFDNLAGMPAWPTEGRPAEEVREFYEGIRLHVDRAIQSLGGER